MTKKSSKFKEGDYSLPMLDFLGEDILRESVKESDLVIETAQRLSGEVRSKALGTIGVLATFAVALFVATYEIPQANWLFHDCCICLMAVFGYGIMRLFWGIIYNKGNQNGGSTLSYLFNQATLDGLTAAKDDAERVRLFLFYSLGQKEAVCNKIDEETGKMQACYKSTMTWVFFLATGVLILYGLVCLLCRAQGVAVAY